MARSTKSSGKRDSAAAATQLLRKDHKTVQQLFGRFEKAGERAYEGKQRLFSEIEKELETHAMIEEEIFYPAVQAGVSDFQDTVAEAIEEHNVVKGLLREIGAMRPEDEQYDAKVKVLQENVEHHVEEEENEMFPKVERELGPERLHELGAEMEARKEALAQPTLKRIISGVTGLIFGNAESKASGGEPPRAGRAQPAKSGARRSAVKATAGKSQNAKKPSGRSAARKRATATAKKRGSGRSAAAKATVTRRSSKKRGGGTAASAKRRTAARKGARKR